MNLFTSNIESNQKIAPDHYRLSFRAVGIAKKVKPGQFFNIRIGDSYEPLLRRPFGAHKIGKNTIEILYKVVGKATEILATKKKGEILDIIGPLGNGFSTDTYARHCRQSQTKRLLRALSRPRNDGVQAILVAGGHGVAPLVALANQLSVISYQLSAFIGARTRKHVVCEKDFKKLGGDVHIATDDGSKGYKGVVTDLLSEKIRSSQFAVRSSIYACGPKPMLKEVAKLAKRYKIPCQVSLEEYIACGVGTCLGCAVKTKNGYKMVCKDGPVFDSEEVVWE